MKSCLNKSENKTGSFLPDADVRAKDTVFCADIGTSSLKAALICPDGKVIAFSQQNFAGNFADSKTASQWLLALCQAAKSFADKLKTVKGICISGNGPTIVAQDGTTLLWNADISACEAETSKIAGKLAEKATKSAAQKNTTKSLFIPRLAAFRQMYSSQWKNSDYVFSGPEYLMYLLTGQAVTVLPEQRFEAAYWNSEELLRMGFSPAEQKKFPSFVAPAFNLGKTTEKITAQLGLPQQVPVFCGAPDFVAALIGTNTLTPGKICDRAGSSEGINLCTDKILKNPKIRMLPSVMPGLWNASVLIPNSGKLFSEYKQKTEKVRKKSLSYEALVEECLSAKSGEGFAIMQDLAEKTKCAIEILQKALDSAVSDGSEKNERCAGEFEIPPHAARINSSAKTNICAAKIPSFAAQINQAITITGGQAKSEKWVQMKANTCGRNFELCSVADCELLGDAVLAYVGLGKYKTIQEAAEAIVKKAKVFVPKDRILSENNKNCTNYKNRENRENLKNCTDSTNIG